MEGDEDERFDVRKSLKEGNGILNIKKKDSEENMV